ETMALFDRLAFEPPCRPCSLAKLRQLGIQLGKLGVDESELTAGLISIPEEGLNPLGRRVPQLLRLLQPVPKPLGFPERVGHSSLGPFPAVASRLGASGGLAQISLEASEL